MKNTILPILLIWVCLGRVVAQLSTDATTFPTYGNGVYTTTIKETNTVSPQTNAIVKVNGGQVFRVLGVPFGWYPIGYVNNFEKVAVSLDGVKYNEISFGALGSQDIEIAGPAWIQYIHQPVNNTPVCFITFSLYPITPTPIINY